MGPGGPARGTLVSTVPTYSQRFVQALVKPILHITEGIFALLPLLFWALFDLGKGFFSRLQLRFHRFIKLFQLNVFVAKLVDAPNVLCELLGLVNGVCGRHIVSSITYKPDTRRLRFFGIVTLIRDPVCFEPGDNGVLVCQLGR